MRKLTLEQVRLRFQKQGCQFLDNFYGGIKYEHNFLCNCGNMGKIHVNNFTNGMRCKICADKKIPLEDVKKEFQEHGCEFLDSEYINNKYFHNYKCCCGNIEKTSLKNLRRSAGCYICGKNKRKPIKFIKGYFEKHGCKLVSQTYIGCDYPVKYICKCGREKSIRFSDFQKGQRCYECSGRVKRTLEDVIKVFEERNCKFLDNFYISANHNHNYICECGNASKITLSSFLRGRRCMKCSGNAKHTLEQVKEIFKANGCEFLDNYFKDNKFRHNFICECGNVGKLCLLDVRRGCRCKKCSHGGFKGSLPGYVYLLQRPNQYKIGIYNEGTRRMHQHRKNGWTLLDQKKYLNGQEAYFEELKLKRLLRQKNIPTGFHAFREYFDGFTESWNAVDLEVNSLDDLYFKLTSVDENYSYSPN